MGNTQVVRGSHRRDGSDRRGYIEDHRVRIGGLRLRTHFIIWMAMAFLILPFIPQLVDHREPFVFTGATIQPEDGRPGSIVRTFYHGEYRRDGDCDMFIKRTWVDAKGIEWILMPVKLRYDRGFRQIGLTLTVPTDAARGALRLIGEIEWSCNAFQRLFPQTTELPELTVYVAR